MLNRLFQRWNDWTGDRSLTNAIHDKLRQSGYAVHASKTRDVHLAALERPGWVQVWTFSVETHSMSPPPSERKPVLLFGISRNDGRKSGTRVLLTEDEPTRRQLLEVWAEGLLRRPERR